MAPVGPPRTTPVRGRVRFGRFEVLPVERQLLIDGEPAALGARAFDVLLALIEPRGQLVTKSELLEAVWPGLVVEENNLTVQVSALRKLLGPQAIATIPGRGYRFAVSVETTPPSSTAASDATKDAVREAREPPPLTRLGCVDELLGREAELQGLTAQVGHLPLLSIVGPGGVGKTSLARAVVAGKTQLWRDGIHWIELAPLQDGSQIPHRIAASLGIELGPVTQASEGLLAVLSQSRALIALDNCEHLLADVAALVGDALDRAPEVRWLVTSQVPLRVPREHVHRLDTLQVPPAGVDLSQALDFGAIALLDRRARSADRRFALTDANLPTAIDLCRQLDGLPLAIEMAAARIATLGLHGVRDRLAQRLRLLAGSRTAPARQQTLHAALDWSHALLSPAEQRVFRRLEPFVGGFTIDMAQAVGRDLSGEPQGEAVDEWGALEALSALVDRSLVQSGAEDPPRYFLLESARDYARERLAQAGESIVARERHADAVAARFASARAEAETMRDDEWLQRYGSERDNLRTALAWACVSGKPDVLARLVAALAQLDYFIGGPNGIIEFAIPDDVVARAQQPLRAAAWLEFAWVHYMSGDRARGAALSQIALEDFEELGDSAGQYRAWAQLARCYAAMPGMQEQAQTARARLSGIDDTILPTRTRLFSLTVGRSGQMHSQELRRLIDEAKRSGMSIFASISKTNLTNQLLVEGQFDEAVRSAQAFIDAGEDKPRTRAFVLGNQAVALVRLGRFDDARDAARAALRAMPDLQVMYWLLEPLAMVALKQCFVREAAMVGGHARAIARQRNHLPDPAEARLIVETEVLLLQQMTADELAKLRLAGAALSAEQAFAMAIGAGRG